MADLKNSVFEAFLGSNDFRELDSRHKYAILWASKFYRLINRLMRSRTFEEITTQYPYATKYIREFLMYFDIHGKDKQYIVNKGITKLYIREFLMYFDIHGKDKQYIVNKGITKLYRGFVLLQLVIIFIYKRL
jgi:hypothetical protein